MPGSPERFTQDVDRRMALAREWDELVEQVRAIEGFEDFLRPPRLETLLPAASGGPVVIINVSRWRCDALIVHETEVTTIPLPDLTQNIVGERVEAYLEAVGDRQLRVLRGDHRDPRDLVVEGATDDVESLLDDCLRWMWESFARPVLDHLGHTAPPPADGEWPRVWWCPTGPLTLLPIHAAGDHATPGAAVIDRVISSYTPTLRALVEARRPQPDAEAGAARMLFVGMPETEGQASLPNVRVEERLVARLFGDNRTELIGSHATRDDVLREMRGHRWAHFACHGEQNLADPSHGGVLVHDGMLTVTDLSAQQHRGDFAYLSGCKTAVGGVTLPDEAITLAAALHYTGFRHVVATLWSVLDAEAAQVAERVYERLAHNGVLDADRAAEALHHAVRELRRDHPDQPSVWTPFSHTGP
ncbi:hypothetical protein GCM10010112_89720 [Actinoplanes lobatus]|nr:hypothetical protein GCM10010112_89720 [Actinoplanes lobatus]